MTEYNFSWGFHRFHAMRLMENGKSMVSYRDSIHSSGKKRIVFGLHCAFLHYININCSLGRIHGWKSLLHTFDQSPSDLSFFWCGVASTRIPWKRLCLECVFFHPIQLILMLSACCHRHRHRHRHHHHHQQQQQQRQEFLFRFVHGVLFSTRNTAWAFQATSFDFGFFSSAWLQQESDVVGDEDIQAFSGVFPIVGQDWQEITAIQILQSYGSGWFSMGIANHTRYL